MKNFKKTVTMMLFVIMAISCLSMTAFAVNQTDGIMVTAIENEATSTSSVTRAPETAIPIRSTGMWRYLPYSQIDNVLLCNVTSSVTMTVKHYAFDAFNHMWVYCRINSAPDSTIVGWEGYVDSSDLRIIQ